MRLFLLANFVITFCITTTRAQTCCSGGIPLSNNLGMDILDKGNFQFGIHYDYNNLNTLNFEDETLDDDSRLRITHTGLLNFSYSFSNSFSIEGVLTWVNQRRMISQFGNEILDQSQGLGDGIILAKYNLPNIFGNQSSLSLGFGSKVPLGSSTKKSPQGITLNADLQPGSNAWDLIYWTSFKKPLNSRPSFTLSGRIIYRSTGENDTYLESATYKFGNELQSYFGVSDQFVIFKTMATPNLSFKYRHATHDKIDGFNLDNTGGNWVSVIPSVSININASVVVYSKAELPLYSKVDGTQLTPTYRLTTGVIFRLMPKNQVFNLN